jgi:hypothetical protein
VHEPLLKVEGQNKKILGLCLHWIFSPYFQGQRTRLAFTGVPPPHIPLGDHPHQTQQLETLPTKKVKRTSTIPGVLEVHSEPGSRTPRNRGTLDLQKMNERRICYRYTSSEGVVVEEQGLLVYRVTGIPHDFSAFTCKSLGVVSLSLTLDLIRAG